MAMKPGFRPRSLDVQKAQAEERRQRLEEQRHDLDTRRYAMELRKHEVEKAKISIEVLKHFSTVIVALIFILAYFGDRLIPSLEATDLVPSLNMTAWDIGVMGLALTLAFSLFSLINFALNPEPKTSDLFQRIMLYVMLAVLVISVAAVVDAMVGIDWIP
jgi:hypothetical protein